MGDVAGKVFLSYRRGETSDIAGRLHDRISSQRGRDSVFMDTSIDPGVDWTKRLFHELYTSDALVAVIGMDWATNVDPEVDAQSADKDDWVVAEVRAALFRELVIVPVLVHGAEPLQSASLPDGIRALAKLQAVSVNHESFDRDVEVVLRRLEEMKRKVATPEPFSIDRAVERAMAESRPLRPLSKEQLNLIARMVEDGMKKPHQ